MEARTSPPDPTLASAKSDHGGNWSDSSGRDNDEGAHEVRARQIPRQS